jgi:Amt family ammonium transporter
VKVKARFGYDDSLDAFGVHGAGGTIGALLTGVFATKAVNAIFKDDQGLALAVGLVDGNARQVWNQFVAVGVAWVLSIVATLIILKVVDLAIGLRVTEEMEVAGLDLSQHGEEGYNLEE